MIKGSLTTNIYSFLLSKDQIKQMKALNGVLNSDGWFEFLEICARPGTKLYGVLITERMFRVKEKVNFEGVLC